MFKARPGRVGCYRGSQQIEVGGGDGSKGKRPHPVKNHQINKLKTSAALDTSRLFSKLWGLKDEQDIDPALK